jgi:hypothetical protein
MPTYKAGLSKVSNSYDKFFGLQFSDLIWHTFDFVMGAVKHNILYWGASAKRKGG